MYIVLWSSSWTLRDETCNASVIIIPAATPATSSIPIIDNKITKPKQSVRGEKRVS